MKYCKLICVLQLYCPLGRFYGIMYEGKFAHKDNKMRTRPERILSVNMYKGKLWLSFGKSLYSPYRIRISVVMKSVFITQLKSTLITLSTHYFYRKVLNEKVGSSLCTNIDF